MNFDFQHGRFLLEGRSVPSDAIGFYEAVFQKIEEYRKCPEGETILEVKLEYFNTASAKNIMKMIEMLGGIHKSFPERTVLVNWYYCDDDEDMEEAGRDMADLVDGKVSFDFIEVAT